MTLKPLEELFRARMITFLVEKGLPRSVLALLRRRACTSGLPPSHHVEDPPLEEERLFMTVPPGVPALRLYPDGERHKNPTICRRKISVTPGADATK